MKKILAVLLILVFLSPILAFAQEKATVKAYDKDSRMATFTVGDAEKKAKVSSADAKDKADLLKEGTKVMVEFEDRGGGDIRVKSIAPR